MDRIKDSIRELVENEDGGVETITLCLWLPMVMSCFMFVADLSFIMFSRANLIRVAEDNTRLRAMGQLADEDEVRQAIRDNLPTATPAEVTVGNSVTAGIVITRISVPMSELDMLGIVSAVTRDSPITVIVTQYKEDQEA